MMDTDKKIVIDGDGGEYTIVLRVVKKSSTGKKYKKSKQQSERSINKTLEDVILELREKGHLKLEKEAALKWILRIVCISLIKRHIPRRKVLLAAEKIIDLFNGGKNKYALLQNIDGLYEEDLRNLSGIGNLMKITGKKFAFKFINDLVDALDAENIPKEEYRIIDLTDTPLSMENSIPTEN
jgi:hypothetical protein